MSSASRGLAPREGLECLLVKMGRIGPLVEPHRGPRAGKSGNPRSENTDSVQKEYVCVKEKGTTNDKLERECVCVRFLCKHITDASSR